MCFCFSPLSSPRSHDLMACVVNMLPFGLGGKVTFDQLKAVRTRALKKKAREEKKE